MRLRQFPWPRLVGVGCALGALGWTLAHADLSRTLALVARAGPLLATALVPYAIALAVDSLAWRVFAGSIASPPFASLYRVRLRCDSFASTLPGGTLLAESVAPAWLRHVMSVESAAAAVAGRKCVVGVAEGLYMIAGVASGASVLAACSPALPWIAIAAACGMLALFGGSALALASGSIASRLRDGLGLVPVASLRRFLASHADSFARADARLVALFRASPRRLVASCALAFVAWSVEALETWWLLHLVGVDQPLAVVYAFESSVSLLRSVGSFAPGGIGVQDVGYVAVLSAIGVPDAVSSGAAFLVLKRGKELAWAAAGYATLLGARTAGSASRPEPALEAIAVRGQ